MNRIVGNAVAFTLLWAVWIVTIVLILGCTALVIRFLVGAP